MKHNHYAPGKANPHLPHDGVEIEATPTDTEKAQRDADLLVSQLMDKSTKPVAQAALTRAPAKAAIAPAQMTATQDAADQDAADATPRQSLHRQPAPEDKQEAKGPVELRDETAVKQELREAFPALSEDDQNQPAFFQRFPPVYFVAFACGFIVFLWPTLLFWMLVGSCLSLFAVAGLMKIPGVPQISARLWDGFSRRAPARAEVVRKMADRLAISVERGLDMLPGSLADRLSLPDFSQPVTPKR